MHPGESTGRHSIELSKLLSDRLVRTRVVWDEAIAAWLKCEQEQHTGSFKWRGALARLYERPPGSELIAASTGNHGLAVARAARMFGHSATIYLPATAAGAKKKKLEEAGVRLVEVSGDSLAAELAGKSAAQASGSTWVSPYNDPLVIAGQGTIGVELLDQLPDLARVYVTVGGGGLVSGIASVLKEFRPGIEIIGCQPAQSPEMSLSVRAGRVVDFPEAGATLSDGSAGPLEPDSITFPVCQTLVDRWILVSEEEIRTAMRQLYRTHGMVTEGAAGVAYAAATKDDRTGRSGSMAVILCGGNIDPEVFRQIVEPG